ncbi:MAG TPA: phosphopantetheine-binding protein [Solirubrobacteraceae bacterium]|jgi:acyl carrier protein|nr:phosphopantetheine-binding protein [Solirubrobacteraceae bacterium]
MAEVASGAAIESKVFDMLATLGPERDEITHDALLEDLEIDSLDVVEMAQWAEDEFDVTVDPERFVGSKTAGDLADRLAAIVAEAQAG